MAREGAIIRCLKELGSDIAGVAVRPIVRCDPLLAGSRSPEGSSRVHPRCRWLADRPRTVFQNLRQRLVLTRSSVRPIKRVCHDHGGKQDGNKNRRDKPRAHGTHPFDDRREPGSLSAADAHNSVGDGTMALTWLSPSNVVIPQQRGYPPANLQHPDRVEAAAGNERDRAADSYRSGDETALGAGSGA